MQTQNTPDTIVPFTLAGQTMSLAIYTSDEALTGIDFLFEKTPGQTTQTPRTALAEDAAEQLQAYLDDPQRPFDLPLDLGGTPFQRRLWSALSDVPAGDTATYGQLVKRLGMKGGAQAVGQACRRNPVPIVVPCHRILSQSGIGGYVGETGGEKLRFKQALLNLETSVGSRKSTQALGAPGKAEKLLITNKVTTNFSASPCTPISYESFSRPAEVFRLKHKGFAGG